MRSRNCYIDAFKMVSNMDNIISVLSKDQRNLPVNDGNIRKVYDNTNEESNMPCNISGYLQFIANYKLSDIVMAYAVYSLNGDINCTGFIVITNLPKGDYFIGTINLIANEDTLPYVRDINRVPVVVISRYADITDMRNFLEIRMDLVEQMIPHNDDASVDIINMLARKWILLNSLSRALDSDINKSIGPCTELVYRYDKIRDEKYATVAIKLLIETITNNEEFDFLKSEEEIVDYLFSSTNIFNELIIIDDDNDTIETTLLEFDKSVKANYYMEEDDEDETDNPD